MSPDEGWAWPSQGIPRRGTTSVGWLLTLLCYGELVRYEQVNEADGTLCVVSLFFEARARSSPFNLKRKRVCRRQCRNTALGTMPNP